VILFLIPLLLANDAPDEPEHAANPVYASVRHDVMGAPALLPNPIVHDGQTADAQRAALRHIAGSDVALRDLLRNSVTAPFKLKHRSADYPEGTVRLIDLWFVVHADLDELHLKDLSARSDKGSAEAGNMRFEARSLSQEELQGRKLVPKPEVELYVHTSGRLFDRIGVETTGRSYATRSAESLVVASQTVAAFDEGSELPNRWWNIGRNNERGDMHSYPGGSGYAKVSKLAFQPGALLVEAHVAFAEPKAWFDGAPILRSKISLIAQDQVRRLRRGIAKRATAGPSRPARP
jgi:hypothetical protein